MKRQKSIVGVTHSLTPLHMKYNMTCGSTGTILHLHGDDDETELDKVWVLYFLVEYLKQ